MYEVDPRTDVPVLAYGREDQMASDGRDRRAPGRELRFPLLAAAAVALAFVAFAARASAEVVYDNPPPAGAEAEALVFAGSGTAELGSLLRFAGAARSEPVVRVPLTAGPCDAAWAGVDCAAAEPTFPLAATLSVYATDASGAVGEPLAQRTETFELGFDRTQAVAFPLAGVTLPPEAIVSLAFDTATAGYQPTGVAGPADSVAVLLAGPPAVGASPREAQGIYRAGDHGGGPTPFEFEADPSYAGRQPAFTVEAAAPAPALETPAAPPAAAASTTPPVTTTTRVRTPVAIPRSRRMTLSFPRRTARIAGPGALVQVRCKGSGAARCIGNLTLSVAGVVHKAPYSISKGRRQFVIVPLGEDLEVLDALEGTRATVTASTIQGDGAAVTARKTLRLK